MGVSIGLDGAITKLIKVINSCETLDHLEMSERYLRLFKQRYVIDDETKVLIERIVFSKKMKLNNGW
jgi:hypothetical protein